MSIAFPNLSKDVFIIINDLKTENNLLKKQIEDLSDELKTTNSNLEKTQSKLELIHSLFNKIYKEWKTHESQISKLSWLAQPDPS